MYQMKIIDLKALYEYDYTVKVINAMVQRWQAQDRFSCIGQPKRQNILVYFNNCNGKYTMKNGDVLYAQNGDIIYTSEGCFPKSHA